jgi:hypothetical protein
MLNSFSFFKTLMHKSFSQEKFTHINNLSSQNQAICETLKENSVFSNLQQRSPGVASLEFFPDAGARTVTQFFSQI